MLNFLSNRFCLSVIMFLSLLIFVLGCQDAKEMVSDVIQPEPEPMYTYLVLKPDGDDTLTPSNSQEEWRPAYLGGFIHEKTRDGQYYTLLVSDDDQSPYVLPPEWIISNPMANLFDQDFEHWIYLHAESKVTYRLNNDDYSHFSGYVALADPWAPGRGCAHSGSVAFFFEVDNEIVFSSGRVIGIEQTEAIRVEFDIPTDAQTLTIFVSGAGDGINCDHWTMGDARLLHR